MEDRYQKRYLAHQKRKKDVLVEIMKERHSNRRFSDKEVPEELIEELLEMKNLAPSSCDRKAILPIVVKERDAKALLGGVLVGGVGWIHRAPVIILLFADLVAYKAGDEYTYMPYLDAGCAIQQLYLTATAQGLHCAYSNPNIREENKDFFNKRYGGERLLFCGAFAVGFPLKYDVQ
jgi:nitroreductase